MAGDSGFAAFLRRHLLGILLLVLAGLGVAGFLWWRARSQKPQYVTATVTRGNIQRSVAMTGALNPVVTVQVGSYVSGTIKSLKCDYNTEVVIGQVCATIDPVPFQLIVDQDQAEVGTAEAQLKKDRAAMIYAKIAYERDSKLLAEGTVSQDTVDNEKSAYDQAAAQLGLDQATIVNKQAILKAAQVNLAYTNILSPVVGTVITRSIDVGQTVAASLQTPTLFLIGKDLTKMQVDTNVSEADVGAVRVGQAAFFTVQAFPGRTFHARVMVIRHGPITVQNVVTYDVVLAVANPDRALFPGMTADTHIVIDERDGVLRVPLPALRFSPDGIGHEGGRGGGARGGGRPEARAAATAEGGPAAGADQQADNGLGAPPEGGGANGAGRRRDRSREGAGGEAGQPGGQAGGGPDGGFGARHARHDGRPGRHAAGAAAASRRGRVWVLREGKLLAIPVTTGLDDGALVEVSGGGLREGDLVVVNEASRNDAQAPRPGNRATPNQGQIFREPGPRL